MSARSVSNIVLQLSSDFTKTNDRDRLVNGLTRLVCSGYFPIGLPACTVSDLLEGS